jgi:hypothetical protein
MVKTILTKLGAEILIDDEDFDVYSKYTWYLDKDGYPKAYLGGGRTAAKSGVLHRLILGLSKGEFGDHINGIRTDCRRSNLRKVTRAQNNRNVRMHKDNKSGYKGVHVVKDKFVAKIMVDGKTIHLGSFDNGKDANEAYKAASQKYHGEYGNF